jgi:hypothetical protein
MVAVFGDIPALPGFRRKCCRVDGPRNPPSRHRWCSTAHRSLRRRMHACWPQPHLLGLALCELLFLWAMQMPIRFSATHTPPVFVICGTFSRKRSPFDEEEEEARRRRRREAERAEKIPPCRVTLLEAVHLRFTGDFLPQGSFFSAYAHGMPFFCSCQE